MQLVWEKKVLEMPQTFLFFSPGGYMVFSFPVVGH